MALIGAGVGITPLRALAEGLRLRARATPSCCYRYTGRAAVRSASSRRSPPSAGCEVIWLPGPPARAGLLARATASARPSDLTALTYWVPDIAERDVYVCGPEPWADDVRRTTEAAGLPADRFHVESFGW